MNILAGTTKGLVVFKKKQGQWLIEDIHFLGMPISMVFIDERTDTWWISLSHRHWGQKLQRSIDQGKNWENISTPSFSGREYQKGETATLQKIWCMQHAGIDKPGCLWLGTEPGGLFYSKNNGQSFELVSSLWNHPSRIDENQWFGAGRDYPFIHSIVLDPRNSDHVYVAVSCAGIFKTSDGGETWEPRNNGLKAAYLPKPDVIIGHDPHLLLISKKNPDVLWQQNHCGIFRTENAGEDWADMSGKNGFPNYGFAMTIDENSTDRAWVIPVESDDRRVALNLELAIYYTEDGGENWNKTLVNGEKRFDIVLRNSFVRYAKNMVFGTNSGNLFFSNNEGIDWDCITSGLSSIQYLAIVE